MKKLSHLLSKGRCVFIFLGIISLLVTNCEDEPFQNDLQQEQQLKSFNMLPAFHEGDVWHYKGLVNNDSIEIIIPAVWNGAFMVYAHGYVDPNLPIGLPDDAIGGVSLKHLLTSSGFAYASTSYSENGFAVKEGVLDVIFLGNMLKAHFKPDKIFLGGVSEGGLVALTTLERNQKIFDAGLISCGPVGDFNGQLQYFGDFHVLFKYFYSQELSVSPWGPIDIGSPDFVSPEVMHAWSNGDLDTPLLWVISQNPAKLPALFNVANVPVAGVPVIQYPLLVQEILRFNIMATNDMIDRVHGVPFDNTSRIYTGDVPIDYVHLNNNVVRIKGDKQAFRKVESLYETNGSPSVPVVFMHTEGDHITPVWHIDAYLNKVTPIRIGTDIIYLPASVPGHCNYTIEEVMTAIETMKFLVN
ncbi:MAG: hypothetical protein JEZ14_25060 [Marinilabiliaceae bacterium]|nr:hypothetical protein [Marinilabiliaceae bacterium]